MSILNDHANKVVQRLNIHDNSWRAVTTNRKGTGVVYADPKERLTLDQALMRFTSVIGRGRPAVYRIFAAE